MADRYSLRLPVVFQFIRFSFVGIAATFTYFIVANILEFLIDVSTPISSVLAYLLGMSVSYLGQTFFTFQSNINNPAQLLRFIIISLLGLSVSYGFVMLFSEMMHLHALLVFAIISVIIPIVNYILLKFWVFQ